MAVGYAVQQRDAISAKRMRLEEDIMRRREDLARQDREGGEGNHLTT